MPSDRDDGWMMRRLLDKGIAIAGVDFVITHAVGKPNARDVRKQ